MASIAPPLAVGQVSSNSELAGDLGNVYILDGKAYRLVTAAAAVTDPEGKVFTTALSSGTPTWSVSAASSALSTAVAGVAPQALTTDLASGDYFLVQVSGTVTAAAATTGIAADQLVGSSTGSAVVSGAAAGTTSIGITRAAATSGSTIVVKLHNLL